jgi:hypothetical protein
MRIPTCVCEHGLLCTRRAHERHGSHLVSDTRNDSRTQSTSRSVNAHAINSSRVRHSAPRTCAINSEQCDELNTHWTDSVHNTMLRMCAARACRPRDATLWRTQQRTMTSRHTAISWLPSAPTSAVWRWARAGCQRAAACFGFSQRHYYNSIVTHKLEM